MSSPSVSDPYMSSYYASMSYPFMNQGGLSDAAWSNGDPMSFLGGYGQINNDYMSTNGMFSGYGGFSQPGFGWEIPGNDYNAWGNGSAQGRKNDDRMYDNYYNMGPMDYGGMNGEVERGDGTNNVKGVEQGLKGMSLNEKQSEQSGKENGHHHQSGGGSGGGSSGSQSSGGAKTWASVAKQPARPQPQLRPKTIPRAPVMPGKQNLDIGTWDTGNSRGGSGKQGGGQRSQGAWGSNSSRAGSGGSGGRSGGFQPYSSSGASTGTSNSGGRGSSSASSKASASEKDPSHPVLEKLQTANQYNPKDFNMNPKGARYFIIKSYSEDDIHRSIKYSIWCSTEHGNKRLDASFREREGKGPVYLYYSVNGSGHFCGMAQMMSPVDYNSTSSVWAQDKWKGRFEVKWIYVKDVPNKELRHIKLENNDNKPVTNSRDTQEVPPEKGKQVLKIIHNFEHTTSIFDDFSHYEKRQEEEDVKPSVRAPPAPRPQQSGQGVCILLTYLLS